MTRSLLGLFSATLALGAWSCSADIDGNGGDLFAPGTVVDECPPGHTCQTNEDGTIVVVDNGTNGTNGNGNGNGNGSGGFVSSGGSVGAGGTFGTGGGVVGTGGSDPTCTDIQLPEHQNEPCSVWIDWGHCHEEWLQGYCDATCGRCTPNTGSGGTTGSGGGSGGNLGDDTLPDVQGNSTGWASRYWDCCKPHCAWDGPGRGTSPSCSANGTTQLSAGTASGCPSGNTDGTAFTCYSQAPRAISNNISYGYIAVPNPTCGQCYHIQFTGSSHNAPGDPGSSAIAGKHMIVKVTNTGGDVQGGQFDILIPGGGVGAFPNACPAQWGVSGSSLGPEFGGFLAACGGSHDQRKQCVRDKCNLLPAGDLRDGCYWFVDWYQVADNPNFRYEPIACPAGL